MANVLITGAARGIGFELARQYAADGDRVFATCRDIGNCGNLDELRSKFANVTVHKMDVGDPGSITAAAKELGEGPIDVLLNNAGIWRGLEGEGLDDMDFDYWRKEIEVMTFGPFRVVQAFLPNLRKSAEPKIVTITSQVGASTWPHGGNYGYSSAKAAANKVMQILAIDLRDENITVAMMHPGWVQTEMAGSHADIPPSESATGIRKVIGSLTIKDSGKFLKWNGEIHPW